MKKYIVAMVASTVLIIGAMLYYKSKTYDPYRYRWPKSVLLKENVVWLYDSACYKEEGVFKRVYRKYNYEYYDSTVTVECPGNYLEIECAKTYRGDIVFLQYRDVTNFPRRED